MKRTLTIIGVGNVPFSYKWYQALCGQPSALLAHEHLGQVVDSGRPGNGLLLFFRVDD